MSHKYSQLIAEVAADTLEQLAFIFSFSEELDENALWEDGVTGCHVTFDGPHQGEILLAANSAVLPELAANMLGMDDEEAPSQEHQEDALREALNVICGNLLPRIGGVEAVFDISAPSVLPGDEIRTRLEAFKVAHPEFGAAYLSLDEGECHIYLRYDGP
ncbi:MAG: chemotaxis protein CheX [Desulfobacterales bacterium]|nr:chemotaxis protein CheX [Desulfobacterales bacterium]